jgi:hypothetical protein
LKARLCRSFFRAYFVEVKKMERILSFILAALMVLVLVPFSVSAAEADAKIYGPGTLMSTVELAFTGMVASLSSDTDGEFVHATVAPGTYNNNRLQAEFTTEAFSITEYNYIKFMYRTDSPSKRLDVSTRCSIGESWMSSTPVCYGDGQWHELLINTKDITGGKGVAPAGELGVRFILKPFDSMTITLDKEHYFDIKYIACFKSEAEANAYKFKAEDDKLTEELKNVDVFYKEADKATIDGYMTKMDAMIEDIKNSPTSVTVTGKKYYVSATGDDNNDGLSPEKPWKTIKKVNETKFNDGDGVFFKRGFRKFLGIFINDQPCAEIGEHHMAVNRIIFVDIRCQNGIILAVEFAGGGTEHRVTALIVCSENSMPGG